MGTWRFSSFEVIDSQARIINTTEVQGEDYYVKESNLEMLQTHSPVSVTYGNGKSLSTRVYNP